MSKKNNRRMNRLLSVLMVFTMVIALFPTSMASATEMQDVPSAVADDDSSGDDNENPDGSVGTGDGEEPSGSGNI